MLHLGPTQRMTELGGTAVEEKLAFGFVSGLQQRPSTFECLAPATRVVAARLTPLGAWRILGGLPQHELARRVVDLEAAVGAAGTTAGLRQRMGDARDLGTALGIFERWLIARLRSGPAPHPAVRAALDRLSRAAAPISARDLASGSGLSQRRLRELFHESIGVAPARLGRLLRFRGALEHLAREHDGDLAELALRCGYYDQPHLYREFRELAALTPHAYLRALGDGLDGTDVVAP